MNRLLIKNSIYYTLGEILPKVISLFLIPFYAKIFTPSDFGIISYTSSIVVFLPIFCTLCLNSYVLRFYFDCKDEDEQKKLLGSVFLFIFIISTLFFVFGLYAFPILLSRYDIQVPWTPFFFLAFLSFYFDMFSIIPNVYLRVVQNAKFFFILNFSKVLFQYILILIFIFHFDLGLLGFYLGNSVVLFVFIFFYLKILFKNIIFKINFSVISRGLVFALPLCPSAFSYLVISFSDRIMLEKYVGLHDLGIYSIAVTLTFSISMFVNGFYKAIEPELFKKFNKPDFDLFLNRISNIFFFIIFLLSSFISFFSTEILIILTNNNFVSSNNYIYILIIGVALLSINIFLGGLLTVKKSSKILGFSNGLGLVFILFFNFIFIPRFGIYAACISFAFSYLMVNIFMTYHTRVFNLNKFYPYLALMVLAIFSLIIFVFIGDFMSFFTFFIKGFLFFIYILILSFLFKLKLKEFLGFFNFRFLNV